MKKTIKFIVDNTGNLVKVITDDNSKLDNSYNENNENEYEQNKYDENNEFNKKNTNKTNNSKTFPSTDVIINNNYGKDFSNDNNKKDDNAKKMMIINKTNKSNNRQSKNSVEMKNEFIQCLNQTETENKSKNNKLNKGLLIKDPRWTEPQKNTSVTCDSNIISKQIITKLSDCGEACVKNEDCKAFVIDNDIHNCVLVADEYKVKNDSPGWNLYYPKERYSIMNDVNSEECEEACIDDDNCNGFIYNSKKKTCNLYPINIKTSNPNLIYGNKKSEAELYGIYNIYQNNSCVNSSLFEENKSVTKSLGLKLNSDGSPIISKTLYCPYQTNNNFLFSENNEIIIFDENGEKKCIQLNNDDSVTNNLCNGEETQKWYFEKSLNAIITPNNKCLTVQTENDDVFVNVSECKNNVTQQFYLQPALKEMQPDNSTNEIEKFNNVNNYNLDNMYYYLYLSIIIFILILLIKI